MDGIEQGCCPPGNRRGPVPPREYMGQVAAIPFHAAFLPPNHVPCTKVCLRDDCAGLVSGPLDPRHPDRTAGFVPGSSNVSLCLCPRLFPPGPARPTPPRYTHQRTCRVGVAGWRQGGGRAAGPRRCAVRRRSTRCSRVVRRRAVGRGRCRHPRPRAVAAVGVGRIMTPHPLATCNGCKTRRAQALCRAAGVRDRVDLGWRSAAKPATTGRCQDDGSL